MICLLTPVRTLNGHYCVNSSLQINYQKKLGDLVKEIDKNLNQHGINLLKTALQSQENRDWVIGWLDELVDNYDGKKRVNLTDPESRKMKMKDGTSRYAYTLQTVRDVKTGFTVSQRITQEKK